MKKALVIGVILLFLGVGFQPALANEISAVDEDCLECQPVNRVDLLKVKLLLIRLEVFTNIVLSKLGHIPEVKEKCQEVSDKMSILNVITEELKLVFPIGNIIICIYFLILGSVVFRMWDFFDELSTKFEKLPIIAGIFHIWANIFVYLLYYIASIMTKLKCPGFGTPW